MLITISRQFGAGGSAVARLVAEKLGWSVVDNEIVDLVAQRAGITHEEVARLDERTPGFVERLARTLAASSEELAVPGVVAGTALEEPHILRITETVVQEVAAQGRAVLVGRAAVAVLSRQADALHVRVVAPKPFRIRVIMERLKLDARNAERALDETDAERSRYHREHYGRDWDDPINFHMVLNTERLGFNGAAEIVVGRAKALGWTRKQH